MKKTAIIFLLCILQAGISQNRTELELLLERQSQNLKEAEFQLDSLEQVLKNLLLGVVESSAPSSLLRSGSQPLVIVSTLLWVRQNPISLSNLFEAVLCTRITWVAVGMI